MGGRGGYKSAHQCTCIFQFLAYVCVRVCMCVYDAGKQLSCLPPPQHSMASEFEFSLSAFTPFSMGMARLLSSMAASW